MKAGGLESADWAFRNKEFNEYGIQVATKDGLHTYIQDELEDKHEDYRSITNVEWCKILSTTEANNNSKRAAAHTKRLATYKAALVNSDRNNSIRVPCKNKVMTGVLISHKQHG